MDTPYDPAHRRAPPPRLVRRRGVDRQVERQPGGRRRVGDDLVGHEGEPDDRQARGREPAAEDEHPGLDHHEQHRERVGEDGALLRQNGGIRRNVLLAVQQEFH